MFHKKNNYYLFYFILIFTLIESIKEAMLGNYNNFFICLLTTFLYFLPFFIEKIFKIKLSNFLKIIIIIFAFSAEILGEILNFYTKISCWDFILHIISGFIIMGIGLSLFQKLSHEKIKKNLLLLLISSFCFSITISVFWEFFEYLGDKYIFNTDMQKDTFINNIVSVSFNQKNLPFKINNIKYTIIYLDNDGLTSEVKINNGYLDIGLYDTINDLFANLIGTSCFFLLAFFYFTKSRFNFIKLFLFT